ncbi:MAG: hypothetical protein ACI4V1_01415 [Eubacteriales bacterium]
MKKISNDHPYLSKAAAAGLCLTMLSLGLSSCGVIEMRDSSEETGSGEADTVMMLAPAERKNEVEVRTKETEVTPAAEETLKSVVKFTAAGDIRMDEAMIADAANRAGEGSTYSFLKMYSGIYRDIHEADVAVGSYSTAAAPYLCEDKTQTTPIESLAALAELGFEVLDTTGADPSARYAEDMAEYGVANLHAAQTGNDAVQTVEQNGITLAFLASVGAADTTQVIEYADNISDVVVVSVDWADGMSDKEQSQTAAAFAQAGADIILGSGNTLGRAEWIDAGDGTRAFAAYSLGFFAATADSAEELCGGILSMDIALSEGVVSLENVCVEPIVMHYTEANQNYQIFELKSYTEELAALHALQDLELAGLTGQASRAVGEFLPSDFRG